MGFFISLGDGTEWLCLVGAHQPPAKYHGGYSLRCHCRYIAGLGVSRVYEYRVQRISKSNRN